MSADSYYYECEELQLLYTLIPQENYIKNGRFMTKITHLSQNQNKVENNTIKGI